MEGTAAGNCGFEHFCWFLRDWVSPCVCRGGWDLSSVPDFGFCSCLSCGQEDAGRRLGLRLPLPPTFWDLVETSLAGMQFWGRRGAWWPWCDHRGAKLCSSSSKQTETMMMDPRLPREATNRTVTLYNLQLIINLSFHVWLQMSGRADKAIPLRFSTPSLALSDTFLWPLQLLFTDG